MLTHSRGGYRRSGGRTESRTRGPIHSGGSLALRTDWVPNTVDLRAGPPDVELTMRASTFVAYSTCSAGGDPQPLSTAEDQSADALVRWLINPPQVPSAAWSARRMPTAMPFVRRVDWDSCTRCSNSCPKLHYGVLACRSPHTPAPTQRVPTRVARAQATPATEQPDSRARPPPELLPRHLLLSPAG